MIASNEFAPSVMIPKNVPNLMNKQTLKAVNVSNARIKIIQNDTDNPSVFFVLSKCAICGT
jgi:hypothetical protein